MRRISLLAALVAAATLGGAVALAAAPTVHGKVCGAKACPSLPATLAKALGQRNGIFSTANAPKPAPYYKIVIKEKGEGYINRTIVWVPSRKLWFDKQYVTPPIAGYWRTDQKSLRSKLTAFVRKLKPYPAPAKWSTVLPK